MEDGNKIQRGLSSQQTGRDEAANRSVKLFKLSGRVQVIGSGETSFKVPFPITFAERPGFSFGYELADHQVPIAGDFPIVSAGVAFWDKIPTKIAGTFNYTGAVITAVATGNLEYLWVHWHFEGKGFQNPINDLSSPGVLE